jgi:hypothetical protein
MLRESKVYNEGMLLMKEKMKEIQKQEEELQGHLKAIAQILWFQTPREELQDFASIELAVRDKITEKVAPVIGNFFECPQSNRSGKKKKNPDLFGEMDN